MNGPWEYYANWNKSEGERQKACDFIHMWTIKQINNLTNKNEHRDTENRAVVARVGGERQN